MNPNITILIFSCKQYSDLWDNNIFLLDKYWPNHPGFKIISDGFGKDAKIQNDSVCIINKEQSDRIIDSLKMCDTKYVFFTLDDYFLSDYVKVDKIEEIIMFLEKNGLQFARLYKKPKIKKPMVDKKTGLRFLNFGNEVYELNFYPGIWEKNALLTSLTENETIWQAEVMLTERFKNNGYKGVASYNRRIFPFVDVVRKGKYLRKAYSFLKKNNLFIGNRKKRTIAEEISLFSRTLVSDLVPYSFKKKLKKMGNKRGKHYFSDYYDANKK